MRSVDLRFAELLLPGSLDLIQLRTFCRILVMAVQRIATGGQTVARRRCAIAECSTDALVLNITAGDRIPKHLGIRQ